MWHLGCAILSHLVSRVCFDNDEEQVHCKLCGFVGCIETAQFVPIVAKKVLLDLCLMDK